MVSSRYEIIPTAHQDQKVIQEFTNQSLDAEERIRNFFRRSIRWPFERDVLALTGVSQRVGCPTPNKYLV